MTKTEFYEIYSLYELKQNVSKCFMMQNKIIALVILLHSKFQPNEKRTTSNAL